MYIYFFGYIEEFFLNMYCFQHADKGVVRMADIPIPEHRGGSPIVAYLGVPVIGLREVERNLQGLTMGIPPLRRGEVTLHLQRQTVEVPKNINSLLRRVVHTVICYS
jgi:hypothetical protein